MMSQPLREYIAKRKERENYTTICARKTHIGWRNFALEAVKEFRGSGGVATMGICCLFS